MQPLKQPASDERVSLQELLLGRRERGLLRAADRRALRGSRLLVTGAGGSIGSALARLLAECAPARLVLFDQSEYNLFRIERELRASRPDVPIVPVLGDVSRAGDIDDACERTMPDVVYHAAAYKHVTMAERAVLSAVRTNVFGTWHAARAAAGCGARFVQVSTDKAAQPLSVMGATKRLAELVALTAAGRSARVVAVRFGNVLGSSGSVLELMLEQMRDGRPIELTDPRATRYFMTPREAVSLIVKADLLGRTGEILWLDMGQPVRIADLAERVQNWGESIGLRRVPVRYIGLRPGEKLREELTTIGLSLARTSHPRIWTARQPRPDVRMVRRVLRALRDDIRRNDALTALADLQAGVPEYTPSREAREAAAAGLLAHAHSPSDRRPRLNR
ncbi:MAG TPA: polysaccharide biosynthesis protein [Vicinamibacterales bacterium]